jgi:hypothetical protein
VLITSIAIIGVIHSAFSLPSRLAPGHINLSQAAQWLAKQEDITGLIVTTTFGDTPELLYPNNKNAFLSISDPAFLRNWNRELWDAWIRIIEMNDYDYPHTLRGTFDTNLLLVVHKLAPELTHFVQRDPRMKSIYKDPNCTIAKVAESAPGYIKKWQVSKVYAREEKVAIDNIVWTQSYITGDYINLLQQVAPIDSGKVFCRSYLVLGEEVSGIVALSMDDFGSLWINGVATAVDYNPGVLVPDEIRLGCIMPQGRNTIIVSITQIGGKWGFSLRFYTRENAKTAATSVKVGSERAGQ